MVAFVFSLNISLFVCLQLCAARITHSHYSTERYPYPQVSSAAHTHFSLCICSCHSRLHTSSAHYTVDSTKCCLLMDAGRWLINYPRIILPRKLPFVSSQQCVFLHVPLYASLYLCLYLHICLTGFSLDAVQCPGANNTLCVSLCVAD